MWKVISDLFFPTEYMPHGTCYLWQPSLIWLNVVSDLFIAFAYFSIPACLIYFVRRRSDVPFANIFVLFGAFIISCGTTHLLEVWTLWHPAYWVLAGVKLLTALVSIYTVIEIIPIIPQALSLPSPAELGALNEELITQIDQREEAEKEIRQLYTQLEQRVVERTLDLELLNLQIQENKYFAEKITDLTPNIIYIYDLAENRNIFCNRFVNELLGYSPQEVQAMGQMVLAKVIHPDHVEEIKEHFHSCLDLKGDQFIEIEYRVQDVKGKSRWLAARNAIFERDQDGIPKQIIGIAYEITKRKETELQLKQLNQELASRVNELESRTQEMIQLGELNDYLQACLTTSEVEKALPDLLKPLFPNCSGSVFIFRPSKDLLEAVATWGDTQVSNQMLLPSECWGIRRGSIHKAQITSPKLFCQHIEPHPLSGATLCLPLSAQGETLGLLNLYFPQEKDLTAGKQRLGETVSKQLGLSFANLKLQQTLKEQSIIDSLTGLYNRRHLEQALTKEVGFSLRKQQPMGLIILDLDNFSRFNDVYGHQAGDLALREISRYIMENIRSYDIACRYGAEKFAIIMPGSAVESTLHRAEQLREGINKLQFQFNKTYVSPVSASFGVCCCPTHSDNTKGLLRLASEAVDLAKQQGKDRVVLASST